MLSLPETQSSGDGAMSTATNGSQASNTSRFKRFFSSFSNFISKISPRKQNRDSGYLATEETDCLGGMTSE